MHARLTRALALTCVLCLSSCFALEHQVGAGAGPSPRVEQQRQWYALWGLVPLGQVESKDMAGTETDYTVRTRYALIDVLLNLLTGPLSFYSQTIEVEK